MYSSHGLRRHYPSDYSPRTSSSSPRSGSERDAPLERPMAPASLQNLVNERSLKLRVKFARASKLLAYGGGRPSEIAQEVPIKSFVLPPDTLEILCAHGP